MMITRYSELVDTTIAASKRLLNCTVLVQAKIYKKLERHRTHWDKFKEKKAIFSQLFFFTSQAF